jgi:ribosomal protein S27AE
MVSLKTLQCPRCGASVKLDDAGERALCPFCGTVSYTERVGMAGAPVVVVKSHLVVVLSLSVGLLALLISGVAVLSTRTHGPSEPPSAAAPKATLAEAPPPPAPAPAPAKPSEPVRAVASHTPAQLVDGDGDGASELLVPITRSVDGKSSAHFALYSLPGLKLVRETDPLEEPQRALAAVVHNRLLLAHPQGELLAYDLASGARQWSSALGERVAALCAAEAKHGDALQVATDDGRNLLIDVTTGRQSTTRTPCPYPLAIATGRHHPADRRDYRAPRPLRALVCGSVRVMGSQNYQVADACRTQFKVDADRLDGMVAHAVWALEHGMLVFGVRKPGTYIPMVGVRERARWRWKSEVPHENPLAAAQGGPRVVSLHADGLVIAYADERHEQHWLTRFQVRDGTRTWTIKLPSGRDAPLALVQSDVAIAVHTQRALHVLAPADGRVLASLGGSH